MSIGSLSAEQDEKFLNDCFIETSNFEILKDFSSPKCILLGRTGSGKSAAIMNLKNVGANVIEVEPQALALNYISNSDVLKFFSTLGVDLDLFYNLLWKHILCVELLKHHFKLRNEKDLTRLQDWLASCLGKNKAREMGVKYLERWNSRFWAETEERVKEITEKLEKQITAGAELEKFGIKAHMAATQGLTQETKSEIVHKAQKVVNAIQIQDLAQVINLLADELFIDDQKPVYITIDSLDENWVEDHLRYKLIRSLIEATKKLKRIQNVKIIIALRTDLLERVYRYTRDAGFQEEKYEDFNLRIHWKPEQLKEIIDSRLHLLFKDQYTNEKIDFYDIFPEKIRGDASLDFIIKRTLLRPRDAIDFVNVVLSMADEKHQISSRIVLDAEKVYSERRKNAIYQEWFAEYPKLNIYSEILQNKPTSFSKDALSDEDLENLISGIFDGLPTADRIEEYIRGHFNDGIDLDALRNQLIGLFFTVGFIGIKTQPTHPLIHSSNNISTFSLPQITRETKISIHPMFWWAFGNYKIKGAILISDDQDDSLVD